MARSLFPALLVASIYLAPTDSARAFTSASTDYNIATSSFDMGGARATSSNYSNDASIETVGGITTVPSPAETIKSGYVGQLVEVTGLVLNDTFINNGATHHLHAQQTFDDGTSGWLISPSQSWSIIAGQLPAGLALDSARGIISGTPTAPGGYMFTLSVTDGLGNTARQTFTPSQTFSQPQTYAQWVAQFPQLSDPSPNATPLHDGVSNLLKYVFDLNPTQPLSAEDRSKMPVLSIDTTATPGSEYLALTYRQYQSLAGVTVTLQTSTDVKSWTTLDPPDLRRQIGSDPTTGDPIIEVGALIPAQTPQQFIRLNITQP